MVIDKLVKRAISNLLPPVYKPGNGKNISSISLLPDDKMRRLAASFGMEDHELIQTSGLTINCGEFFQTPEIRKRNKNIHWIFLNERIRDAEELAFVLLHEVGHVDFNVNGPSLPALDNVSSFNFEEANADFYAYNRLVEVFGKRIALNITTKHAIALGEIFYEPDSYSSLLR